MKAEGKWETLVSKAVLSFHDRSARYALCVFAAMTEDAELAADVLARVKAIADGERG